VDRVLFGLSYSVMPDPQTVLARAWERLRPGGRLVVLDGGLTETRLGRLLAPLVTLLHVFGPGDGYCRPWQDLAAYGPVSVEWMHRRLYHVCAVQKPAA
jgi:SAM-dependent methyltransferase